MEKRIEDYLPLYFGCPMWHISPSGNHEVVLSSWLFKDLMDGHLSFAYYKPILRLLPSITEEEAKEGHLWSEWHDAILMNQGYNAFTPEQFIYLLSKHFDIFNLIESGLAIKQSK